MPPRRVHCPASDVIIFRQVSSPPAHTLSVIIPAHNEERFLGAVLARIRAVDLGALDCDLEVIVVDDGSTDATATIARHAPDILLLTRPRRSGKGGAVRDGIRAATGEFVIIQDADLEYDPRDYATMLQRMVTGDADVVYGSRY